MRLRTLLVPALLLSTLLVGTAAAQSAPPLAPPSGPVVDRQPRPPGRPPAGAHPGTGRPSRGLRAALIARFDRDGDGRLTGRERVRAKRFVMRQRHQPGQQPGRQQARPARHQRRAGR